jgi:hypothetical protein
MTDYSKMSWKELKKVLANNPPDTPHYMKAKEEMDRRLKKWGLGITAGGILIAAALTILFHLLRR